MSKDDWIADTIVKLIDNLQFGKQSLLNDQVIDMIRNNGIQQPELWLLKQILKQRSH